MSTWALLRAFLPGGDWADCRVWVVLGVVVIGAGLAWEWAAIRWLDRAKAWPK